MEDYTLERHLHEQIRMIQVEYDKRIQPYLEQLQRLEQLKPMPPTILTLEQAEKFGLINSVTEKK